jgi:hypothetical protein
LDRIKPTARIGVNYYFPSLKFERLPDYQFGTRISAQIEIVDGILYYHAVGFLTG